MLFSYGSGLCATMMTTKVISNPLGEGQIQAIFDRLANRIKVDPKQYTKIMLERENNFGKFRGSIPLNE
jgi:3-hydroxy-3-methylglutaryl CoA synthase